MYIYTFSAWSTFTSTIHTDELRGGTKHLGANLGRPIHDVAYDQRIYPVA